MAIKKFTSPVETSTVYQDLHAFESHHDIMFHVRDVTSKATVAVGAHAAVICPVSKVMNSLWTKTRCACSAELCNHGNNVLNITLDNVNSGDLKLVLEIIYLGEVTLANEDVQHKLEAIFKMLQIDVQLDLFANLTEKDQSLLDDFLEVSINSFANVTAEEIDKAFDEVASFHDDSGVDNMEMTIMEPTSIMTEEFTALVNDSHEDVNIDEVQVEYDSLAHDGTTTLFAEEDINVVQLETLVDSCKVCGKDFDHGITEEEHQCSVPKMKKEIQEKDTLIVPENIVSNTVQCEEKGDLDCRLCDTRCKSRDKLKIHYVDAHFKNELMDLNGGMNRQCKVCDKKLTDKSMLRYHLGWKHKLIYKFLDQEIVDKILVRSKNTYAEYNEAVKKLKLAKEEKAVMIKAIKKEITETDETPCRQEVAKSERIKNEPIYIDDKTIEVKSWLSCPRCEKTFADMRKMRIHMIMVHLKDQLLKLNGNKTKECDHCDKKFGSIVQTLNHTVINHKLWRSLLSATELKHLNGGREDRSIGSKVFLQCTICPYKTHTRNHIKYHLAHHHSKELFKQNENNPKTCKFCSKIFSMKTHLIVHVGFHHNKIKELMTEADIKKCLTMHPVVKKEVPHSNPKKIDQAKPNQPSRKVHQIARKSTSSAMNKRVVQGDLLKCKYCTFTMEKKNLTFFKNHVATHFMEELYEANAHNKDSCEICGKDFKKNRVAALFHLAYKHDLLHGHNLEADINRMKN